MFEKMLANGNHFGLSAEEIAPTRGRPGNFPQAFTHLALISGAVSLDRLLGEKKSFTARSVATLRGVLSARGH